MTIIGQDKLLSYIDKHTTATFPRTIMLEGPSGSGRHMLTQYISERFSLQIEDISESLTYEKIEEINFRVEPFLYIIDANKLTVKNENTILKFLEEPLKNSFIIVISENRYSMIPTIRNRCNILSLAKYSKEQLQGFITNKEEENIILTICKTPGDIIKMQTYPIKDMLDLCIKIYDKINIASFANTLTLSNNIAFKDEQNKYDFSIFFRAMLYIAKIRVINNEPNSIAEYNLTSEYQNRSYVRNVDKKMLFENFLIALKKLRCGL